MRTESLPCCDWLKLEKMSAESALAAGSGEDAQASESLECSVDGDAIEIAFNPQYLLDGLSVVDAEEVAISFTGPTKPAVLTPNPIPKDDIYKYLLMPVRLSS